LPAIRRGIMAQTPPGGSARHFPKGAALEPWIRFMGAFAAIAFRRGFIMDIDGDVVVCRA
jgi:hypothetical protein